MSHLHACQKLGRKKRKRSMEKHFPTSKDCINIGWWLFRHPLLIFDDGKSWSLGGTVSKTALSRHQLNSYLPFSCLLSCWENCRSVMVFSVYGLQRFMYLKNAIHLNLKVRKSSFCYRCGRIRFSFTLLWPKCKSLVVSGWWIQKQRQCQLIPLCFVSYRNLVHTS